MLRSLQLVAPRCSPCAEAHTQDMYTRRNVKLACREERSRSDESLQPSSFFVAFRFTLRERTHICVAPRETPLRFMFRPQPPTASARSSPPAPEAGSPVCPHLPSTLVRLTAPLSPTSAPESFGCSSSPIMSYPPTPPSKPSTP